MVWSLVAHLTDSSFEAVKISQGCVRCWKTVPLNDFMKIEWVFIIISPGGYLPVSQWVGGTGSMRYGLWRERYSYVAIDNLIKRTSRESECDCLRLRHRSFPIMSVTQELGGIIPKDPSGCSSLNSFNFMYVILSVGVPYWSSILQMGSDNGFVCISLSEVFCVLRFFHHVECSF